MENVFMGFMPSRSKLPHNPYVLMWDLFQAYLYKNMLSSFGSIQPAHLESDKCIFGSCATTFLRPSHSSAIWSSTLALLTPVTLWRNLELNFSLGSQIAIQAPESQSQPGGQSGRCKSTEFRGQFSTPLTLSCDPKLNSSPAMQVDRIWGSIFDPSHTLAQSGAQLRLGNAS